MKNILIADIKLRKKKLIYFSFTKKFSFKNK